MPSPAFIHLRLHSEYSIVNGIVRIEDAIARAAEIGMPALALTDLSNVFGMVKFYDEARSHGIKPIIGCDVWIENRDKPSRLLVLCQNNEGYLRLCRLLSRAYRDNLQAGRAEIRRSWFSEEGSEGLIALSGNRDSDIGMALEQGKEAGRLASEWAALFPGRFYLELNRTAQPGSETLVKRALALAAELKLPAVAAHPIQFLRPEDFKAHETRVCIAEGGLLADKRRAKIFTPDMYFKSVAEMSELFADIPEALANSVHLAKRCNVFLELGRTCLPAFPTPPDMTLDAFLRHRAKTGLEARLTQLFVDPALRAVKALEYRARLEFEISMIEKMGYSGYFLIVADFINWAKRNEVPVGPGRGSGAGSLVAFSLGITDLDPLRYDLLFERFLNPERVSMPDFDIDFCELGRDRVIEYVKNKYGAESVSQIATFGTMAARAVVRDVGRVLDLPYTFCDGLAKLIPFQPGKKITLKDAREMEPLLAEREKKEEEVGELLELADKLEGLPRNVGMHAGGVLIAPGRLTDFCPIYVAEGSDSAVSQLDMKDVEAMGLVKFDFLGLTTLTILDWAVKHIRTQDSELRTQDSGLNTQSSILSPQSFSLESIPLGDKETFAIFDSGNTTAVFQSESRTARDLERRLKPDTFDDIIALMALNRPGPLQSGMVDDFIKRKHGLAPAEYFHPALEPVLKPTYGVIVYQEQVMQIAQILAGYSLGSADLLRRAMGKKKPEEMAKHRTIFVEGAIERGVGRHQAERLFGLMEKFAEYGFNKSHSAAYALIAYQTAYLKAHYPAAFMAATLSAEMDDTDKVHLFYDDCVANSIKVLPPDINLSEYRFVPVDAKCVRYGLGAIKGTGESAIASIVRSRETNGPYRDLFEFCSRVDKRLVNRRVLESLVRAGAFDSIDANRASLFASIGIALEAAEQQSRFASQDSLFSETPAPRLTLTREWPEVQRLQNEKAALGFYFSGHPFDSYRSEVEKFARTRISDLAAQPNSQVIAGIIVSVRIQMARRGRMAIVSLDDASARVDVVVFSDLFEANRSALKEDQLLVVEGKVSHDEFSGGLRVSADKLYDLTQARKSFAKGMQLVVTEQCNGDELVKILSSNRSGTCPVRIAYRNGHAECELELGPEWCVDLNSDLVQSLCARLKQENVRILYQ
ncbi:MAG: DNA polymerase III subunit alpha [Burkholderiales bacterium]